jgi:hypothetical protein
MDNSPRTANDPSQGSVDQPEPRARKYNGPKPLSSRSSHEINKLIVYLHGEIGWVNDLIDILHRDLEKRDLEGDPFPEHETKWRCKEITDNLAALRIPLRDLYEKAGMRVEPNFFDEKLPPRLSPSQRRGLRSFQNEAQKILEKVAEIHAERTQLHKLPFSDFEFGRDIVVKRNSSRVR